MDGSSREEEIRGSTYDDRALTSAHETSRSSPLTLESLAQSLISQGNVLETSAERTARWLADSKAPVRTVSSERSEADKSMLKAE